MKDFDLTNSTGYVNMEIRTDGGINIFTNPNDSWGNVSLSKDEFIKLAGWIVTRAEELRKL